MCELTVDARFAHRHPPVGMTGLRRTASLLPDSWELNSPYYFILGVSIVVITSWLSALSSKLFSKKTPPRTRNQQSKLAVQATQASEVLEERTLMTVNPVIDIYTTGIDEDHAFNVPAPGVLANDPAGVGALATIQVTNTAVGVAVLNADGSFVYTPGSSMQSLNHGEYSIQEFTYKVSDTGDFSVGPTEIVRLYVLGLNDAPTASNATQAINYTEDGGLQSLGAIVADDVDQNDMLTATLTLSDADAGTLSAPGATFSSGVLTITGLKSTVNAALAAVQFTPGTDYDKDFTIAVSIADGGEDAAVAYTGEITMTANPVNDDAPVTEAGTLTVDEDSSLNSGTLVGSDPDTNPASPLTYAVAVGPSHGSVNITNTSTGAYTYTPDADYFGSDSFTFQITDSTLLTSNISTVSVTVTSINDVPSFTVGGPESILEDAGAQSVPNFITAISKGAANESGQTVNFIVDNDNHSLFSAQPSISADGTLTYTAAANQFGTATVTVQIHDDGGTLNGGVDTSTSQTFTITVTAVNDVPTFTVGGTQTSAEDAGAQSVTGFISTFASGPANESSQTIDFVVTNDNNLLFSVQPTIDANGNLTYTAAPDQNGSATVTVYIHDDGGTANGGVDASETQTFTINITAVNDAPSFTKGADETVLEDTGLHTVNGWATAITTGPVTATDESSQTLTFNITTSNDALFSSLPAIDASGNLTYTLAANAFGSAVVTVTLQDNGGTSNGGSNSSAPQTFNINVTGINDIPSFEIGGTETSNEDAGAQSVPGYISVFSPGPNEASQTVNFVVTNDNNPLFLVQPAISADGTLTYTAAPNQNGTATVTVYIHDNGGTTDGGVDQSTTQTFTLNINSVNDAPTFTKGADESVLEDSGLHTVNGWATLPTPGPVAATDEAGQTLTYSVTTNNDDLFSVLPEVDSSGNLTYTLAANAFGTATVTVKLSDNGGTTNGGVDSSTQTFDIVVQGVNDAPSFNVGGTETSDEDEGAQSVPGFISVFSPGPNEATQTVDFVVTNNNPGLFLVQPAISADGTLTYTAAPNQNGTATVTVYIHDNGGTADSGVDQSVTQNFTLNINSVNDAPSFTKGSNEEVLEDSGLHSVTNWATNLAPGPITATDEVGQTLTFNVTTNNDDLFAVLPSINASGTLTYTLAANAFGTATVTVTLSDNGGTANGGSDTSGSQTFDIVVTNVNDVPSFLKGADETVFEDSNPHSVAAWATAISAGAGEGTQTLTFNVTNNDNPTLFSEAPAIAADGTLTYTLAPNANGTAMITITLSDNGGTVNGGIDTSASQTFAINVVGVNDAPSFTKGADESVLEDTGLHTVNNWATGITKGPTADENSQNVTFNVTNSNNAIFSVQPAIDANGQLTYTLAANAFGSAVVSVTLSDDGGTSDGGVNTAEVQTFNIVVVGINDVPTFTAGPNQQVPEDSTTVTTNLLTNGGFESGLTGWTTVGVDEEPDSDNNFYPQTGTTDPIASSPENSFVVSAPPEGTTAAMADQTGPGAAIIYQDFVVPSDILTVTLSLQLYINNHAFDFTDPAPLDDFEVENQQARIDILATTADPRSIDDNDVLLNLFQTHPNDAADYGYSTLTADLTTFLQAHVGETLRLRVATTNNLFYFNVGVDDVQLNVTTHPAEQTVPGWATNISAGAGESQDMEFLVTNDNHALFAVQPAVDVSTGNLTYTLAPNAHGTANVTVILKDFSGTANGGIDTSAPQVFTITVDSVNDAPSFTTPLYTEAVEDTGSHTVAGFATGMSAGPSDESSQILSFIVTNDNNSLFTTQPSIDPVTGDLTYVLAPNAYGNATVQVRLQDDGGSALGGQDSSTRLFTIVVDAVNDAPSFDLPVSADQTVLEDAGAQTVTAFATNISAGPDENDQYVEFQITTSDDSKFEVLPSINPLTGDLTYTPAANAHGDVLITVTLIDYAGTENGGVDTSAPQTFTISITSVNDDPVAADDVGIAVFEDGSRDINVLSNDVDVDGDPLQITIATPPTHGVATVNNNGTPADLTDDFINYTPDEDYFGTDSFTYTISDGQGLPSTATVTMNVISLNDAPTFTIGSNQSVDEDAGPQTVANFISTFAPGPLNEAGQTVTFQVSNDNTGLFSVQPTIDASGTLTYTPAANQYGTATVTVYALDDGLTVDGGVDTSTPQTFTITINAVNDVPSFTVGGNQTTAEDAGAQTVTGFVSVFSPGTNESSQTVDFIVSNDNTALFSVQPTIAADGTLTYTAAPDQNGTATVTVQIHDDGGTTSGGVNTSTTQTFTITITAVNDTPTFTVGANQTTEEDAGAQTVANFISTFAPGPTDEAGQTIDFIVTNDNTSLFSVQPSISADGTLTYTAAANQNGSATVTVQIHDNGGGADTSTTQTFTITITAVNDVPSFTVGGNQTVAEDAGAQTVEDFISTFSPGPADEAEQTIDFIVTNNNNALFSVQPSIAADGTLTYTPAANQNGTATVTVQIHDNAGGTDTSISQTFTISVTAVNDAPVVTDATFSVAENSADNTVIGTISATDADAGDTKTYSITSGNTGGTFGINPSTGQITVIDNSALDFETNPVFHLVVTVTDGSSATGTANVTINLTNVVEPPTLNLPSAPNTFYIRHGQTIIDSAASVTNLEAPVLDFRGGQLIVQVTGNSNSNDRISIASQDTDPGRISINGKNVSYGGTLIGKITQTGAGGTAMIVTFNQSVTSDAVDALLKLVTYKSTSTTPPTAQRTITFTVQNAGNTESATNTQLMNVSTSPPSRAITVSGGATPYVNGAAAVVIAPTALVTGPSSLDFDGGRISVQITSGTSNKNRMGISNVGGITLVGSDVFYNGHKIGRATIGNNSLSVRLSSIDATPEAVQALARAITFSTLSTNTSLVNRVATFTLTDVTGSTTAGANQTITLGQET